MPVEEWIVGTPLTDRALATSVLQLWHEALTLTDDEPHGTEPRDIASAEQMLREASSALIGVLERHSGAPDPHARQARAGMLLAGLSSVSADVRDAMFAWRMALLADVRAALGRLRSAETLDQMLASAPVELCRCGYDRAAYSRVEGSVATPLAVAVADDPAEASRLLREGRRRPWRLEHRAHETEMLRRRAPILVDRPSYVAAPLLAQGQVVGFLHVDCRASHRVLDAFDRDALALFAEGLGDIHDRTSLLQELGAMRQEVRRSKQAILAVIDEFVDADVEVEAPDEDSSLSRSAAALYVPAESRVEALLTARELDVIRLMATGETNAGIAAQLVVSEGTVKSHVKHILRKLRAGNRAEAVSRFIRLSEREGTGENPPGGRISP